MAEEKNIENALVREVKKEGGLCLKFPPIFFKGFPDRIVLLSGARIYFVELKAKKGVVSAIQASVHKRLRSLGFAVYVLNSTESVVNFMASVRDADINYPQILQHYVADPHRLNKIDTATNFIISYMRKACCIARGIRKLIRNNSIRHIGVEVHQRTPLRLHAQGLTSIRQGCNLI